MVEVRLLGLWSLLILTYISLVNSLYEDQIKKFDWRELNIGAPKHVFFWTDVFESRLIISTGENVIASICPVTGKLLWRQVLEKDERGSIQLLYVASGYTNGSVSNLPYHGTDIAVEMLTVHGNSPAIIRGWNPRTGYLEWEWSLWPINKENAKATVWLYWHGILYHVIPVWKSHLEVTQYSTYTGQSTSSTEKITAPWINEDNCTLSGKYYICLAEKQLISLDITTTLSKVVRDLPVATKGPITTVVGAKNFVVISNKLINVKKETEICSGLLSNSFLISSYNRRDIIITVDVIEKILKISAYYVDTCEELEDLHGIPDYPEFYGEAKIFAIECRRKMHDHGHPCLVILGSEDGTIMAVQGSKLKWIREEALSKVLAVEFIDLPLADTEKALENEMKGNTGDIFSAFVRRVTAQILQVRSAFLHVIGLGLQPTDTQKAGIVRDSFGLHKMLVVLTESGKIFGIDNISGKHHWKHYLPNIESFANKQQMKLIVQRTSKHFPLQPICAVVAKQKTSGHGIIYRFNPITGRPSGDTIFLNYQIKQMSLLAENHNDFIKGILIIASNHSVHVYPENVKKMASGMYMYTADVASSSIFGFHVKYKSGNLLMTPIWNVHLGSHTGSHKITAVASKNPIENVHSQGRVLSDRSVLYKYINPNLIAVATQALDTVHKYILNVYLIDAVSGAVIFSMLHRKVRGPLNIAHSENWLVYSYYNDKVRRSEITSIELYEGKTQTNSTVWSSLEALPMPLIERQSYIIPTYVETLRETITERGITNKHILIGTAAGNIVEMPWALLDPRRPLTSSSQGREEGIIPYIPELPLPTENIINYNQTIARISNIFVAPSGLESTCLVVATGLDMFVTRVAPSKTFDLLKEDFDYILITIVLLSLTIGSLVAKQLASRKLLKQAWK